MGIPSYFSYIIRNYSKIVKRLHNEKIVFDNLFMDCNSIIYDSVRSIENNGISEEEFERKIMERVKKNIEDYILLIKPSKTVFIAFDGVAPLAKMEQQKTRRFKNWFMENAVPSSNKKTWNTSKITPGTKFMNMLSVYIQREFENTEKKYHLKKVIVSCSDKHGEGEHKLFEYLRKNPDKNENTIIYGLDSDLIMLSIFHQEMCKNIFIFREAPEFIKSSIKVDVPENSNEPLLLDISMLSKYIIHEMRCKFQDSHRMYDYVFMCFLLGNDFLPHFPALNIRTHGIQVLMDTYRIHLGNYNDRFFISKDTFQIQWRNVSIFIQQLAKYEHEWISEEYETRDKWDTKRWNDREQNEELIQNVPIIYREEEKYICPNCNGWEERYYKILFHLKRDRNSVMKICNNYLEGLEWVFTYYKKGCPDWKWKYNYHYPPLLADLKIYVPLLETNFIETYREPFTSDVQLAYVMSISQLDLLDNKIASFLKKRYLYIYPEKIDFKWAFCRYLWEAHVCFPEISLDVMEKWMLEFPQLK